MQEDAVEICRRVERKENLKSTIAALFLFGFLGMVAYAAIVHARETGYWGQTIRITTYNLNNGWLQGEERRCYSESTWQSSRIDSLFCPNAKGEYPQLDAIDNDDNRLRVSWRDLPVTFYGAVDRGIRSDWNCVYSSGSFACFAIN